MMQEMVVDTFAGGGGASEGIEAAGHLVDVAINHDEAAIRMHAANHPKTKHYTEDVWKAHPRMVTGGRPVGMLWASPDCKHFSRAKGGKPVKKNIRSLAWVVVRWAAEAQPRVIFLENVREFEGWGPVVPLWKCRASGCGWKGTEGQARLERLARACPRCDSRRLREERNEDGSQVLVPDPARKGITFRRFIGRLRKLGYSSIDWKVLNAADYGAPTNRRRLVLVCRRDGKPVVWPARTHADPAKLGNDLVDRGILPYRRTAECLDWTIPVPSIWGRKKDLAEKTMRRIAHGVNRYVLQNKAPFIAPMPFVAGVGGRMGQTQPAGIDAPMNTITAKNDRGVVVPSLAPIIVGRGGPEYGGKPRDIERPFGTVLQENHSGVAAAYLTPLTHEGERKGSGVDEPMPTVTGANRGEQAVIAASLIQYNNDDDSAKNARTVEEPLGTITAKDRFGVTAASLIRYNGDEGREANAHDLTEPLNTVPTENRFGVSAATMIQTGYGERDGQAPRALDIEDPMGACVAGGCKQAHVSVLMSKHYGGHMTPGIGVDAPLDTITAQDHHALTAAFMVHLNHGGKQDSALDEPMRTVMAGGTHAALVYTYMKRYFPDSPNLNHDLGLVIVKWAGCLWVVVDIGMRMLEPRELARGQGFRESYILTGTKTSQVARIGNSVPPPLAQAVVAANYQ